MTERKKRERESRQARLRAGEEIPHGKLSSYNNWGCRCGPCTAAYMEWYSVYATSKRPTKKQLPPELAGLCEGVSLEVAELIQEQYNDDKAQRVGYGTRYVDEWAQPGDR